jgi:hypothetical protein
VAHWVEHHAGNADSNPEAEGYICKTCEVSFPLEDMLVAHFYRESGAKKVESSHHAFGLEEKNLLWQCPGEWIQIFFPRFPSAHLLIAVHQLSIPDQKDHSIFIFRQSKTVGLVSTL